MNPTPAQRERAYAAAMRVKESGPSFTKDARRYSDAIAEAVLEDVPEPKATRKRKP